MVDTNKEKINEVITRGVEEVFIREHLEKALLSGKPLTVKLGIDPTGPTIHLGRAVTLWKLKAIQELGHKIVLIVGDFTAQIGDPSDKLEKRPMLTTKEITENMKGYKNAIGKILDIKKTKFVYNSKWLSKLSFKEVAELAESFSVSQMSNRRNFKERLDRGEEVSLREFLYPLMQGYDSVAINADLELGGHDQLFNLKAGRVIQKFYNKKEQDILITEMLEGTDGRKMSTSWGNIITITDEPSEMFGKIMSLKDELIPKYFLLCTNTPISEIEKIKQKLSSSKENPRDIKLNLAQKIVTLYHGEKKGTLARERFISTFQKKEIPSDIEEVVVHGKGRLLVDVLLEKKIIKSKSEFQRLFLEGAIEIIGKGKIILPKIEADFSGTVRVGKHRFLKIILKD